jgi:seryl-tRNA synthetase
MLDIKWIRENPEKLDEALRNRNMDPKSEEVLLLDRIHRDAISYLQDLVSHQKDISRKIGDKKKKGEDASELTKESKEIKSVIPIAEEAVKVSQREFQNVMDYLPNIPASDVPIGKDEKGNVVVRMWGEKPKFIRTMCKKCDMTADYIEEKLCLWCKWNITVKSDSFWIRVKKCINRMMEK